METFQAPAADSLFDENKDRNNTDTTPANKLHDEEKNKKKHKSALIVAASARSAVQHAHLHIITNRPGDFAHSGTNISYENS